MIHSLAVIALLAAPVATPAPKCITKRQVADAAMVLTPYWVEAVTQQCRKHVPANSFLATKGDALHARLRAESAGREASAGEVILLIMGGDAPPVKETEALVKVMGSMMSAMAASKIPVESCTEVSGVMEAFSPLPAENIGLLAVSAVTLMERGKGAGAGAGGKPANSLGKFEICKGD
jgi:hypothetical protein